MMIRLLSPLLLWAFFKSNRLALSRLFIVAFAYLFVLVIYIDFEAVFFESEIIVFKLIKWLMIMLAIAHIGFVLKTFKSQPCSQQNNHEDHTKPLLTKSQKIIQKYKNVDKHET